VHCLRRRALVSVSIRCRLLPTSPLLSWCEETRPWVRRPEPGAPSRGAAAGRPVGSNLCGRRAASSSARNGRALRVRSRCRRRDGHSSLSCGYVASSGADAAASAERARASGEPRARTGAAWPRSSVTHERRGSGSRRAPREMRAMHQFLGSSIRRSTASADVGRGLAGAGRDPARLVVRLCPHDDGVPASVHGYVRVVAGLAVRQRHDTAPWSPGSALHRLDVDVAGKGCRFGHRSGSRSRL
jgi:hypothetical protein